MSKPTKMPGWMERQFDSAEAEVEKWSDGKREAAGIPRTMSENEMPERIWAASLEVYSMNEDGDVWSAEPFENATEYHRTPTLPDVMEDGYVLAESVGIKWVVEVYDFLFVVALDTGVGRIAMSPEEAAKLGAPDLSNYHVQNNQIVKVEG